MDIGSECLLESPGCWHLQASHARVLGLSVGQSSRFLVSRSSFIPNFMFVINFFLKDLLSKLSKLRESLKIWVRSSLKTDDGNVGVNYVINVGAVWVL